VAAAGRAARAPRLHRRGQLRVVDAAAAPRRALGRAAQARRDDLGAVAANARRKFGFATASTDIDDVLGDESIDAIFVVTRHSSHAELTRRRCSPARRCSSRSRSPCPRTSCRRSSTRSRSPATTACRSASTAGSRRCCTRRGQFGPRVGPATVRYLVNAGRLDHGSWYTQTHRGLPVRRRGRALHRHGELAARRRPGLGVRHGGRRTSRSRSATRTARRRSSPTPRRGSSRLPEGDLDLTADGKVLRSSTTSSAHRCTRARSGPARGSRRAATRARPPRSTRVLEAVRTGGPMPIPVASLAATTLATLAAQTSLERGRRSGSSCRRRRVPRHDPEHDGSRLVPAEARRMPVPDGCPAEVVGRADRHRWRPCSSLFSGSGGARCDDAADWPSHPRFTAGAAGPAIAGHRVRRGQSSGCWPPPTS
jgi:hypothetical protein